MPMNFGLAIAGCLALLTGVSSAAEAPAAAPDQIVSAHRQQLSEDPMSPVIGDAHGDVTIVEFFDYACGFCKAIEPRLETALRNDPHVRLILKEFPILTPESQVAARASLAAARQHKYRQFHEALMGYRGPWQEEAIFSTAKTVGLDLDRLRHDMESPEIANEFIANFNLARGLRVFQTPAFVVQDHILTGPSAEIDFPSVIAAARTRH